MTPVQEKYLFLHYGPGGNSSLERLWLKHLNPMIDFWDQPLIGASAHSFTALAHQCAQKFDSSSYKGIIAHSFGCELALRATELIQKPLEKLYLLSPLRDIPGAFINAAHKLAQITDNKSRRELLETTSAESKLSPRDIPKFMQLVQVLAADLTYYRIFWAQPTKLQAYLNDIKQIIPMDFAIWRDVVVDYILNHNELSFKTDTAATVIAGDLDPYFKNLTCEKKYWEKLGFKFIEVKNAGHYPHLEATVLEKILSIS